MGTVYRANDLTLGREVAIKILQPQFEPGSPPAQRFENEARVTAQLQHPGVPAIYQVGALENGRPFLAMKLIEGRTLDALIKAKEPIDVAAVFEAVAQAVGYAHARGVLHRDLKPANVMVGAFGEVQVMDWGLSKVLSDRDPPPAASKDDPESTSDHVGPAVPHDTDEAMTVAGSILGTPSYMSPEQAAGDHRRIGPPADVFGLGALLCAMLTGKPPYEGETSETVRLNAMRGKTEPAFARLDACGADPDLVALCKRCLAFEPTARPKDANVVALSVGALRRAADERVRQAERDKLSADVRRRATQRAAFIVAAVLLLGVVGTAVGFYRADRARKLAVAKQEESDDARKLAVAKEEESKSVVRFFTRHVLAAARPKGVPRGLGRDVKLREAIMASLPHIDKEFRGEPYAEGSLRMAFGTTFTHLGQYDDALKQYQRAFDVLASAYGETDPNTLNAAANLGNTLLRAGKVEEGTAIHKRSLDVHLQRNGPDHEDTLDAMNSLAFGYTLLDRDAEALELQERIFAGRKRSLGLGHEDTLSSANNLAVNYRGLGRHAEALKLREELYQEFAAKFPPENVYLLTFKANLASDYFDVGRLDEALTLQQEVLDVSRRTLGPSHPEVSRRHWELARTFEKTGRNAEALPHVEACLANAAGVQSAILTNAFGIRARLFAKAGDPKASRESAERWERLGAKDPDELCDGACIRAIAAAAFLKANRPAEAKADADRAMTLLQQAVAAGFRNADHLAADSDFDALRDRADFKKLLESLRRGPPM
jgi:tetratricopeptide (TPR) repeat protein